MSLGNNEIEFNKMLPLVYEQIKGNIGEENREEIFEGLIQIVNATRQSKIDNKKIADIINGLAKQGLLEKKYLKDIIRFSIAVGSPALKIFEKKSKSLKEVLDWEYYFKINDSSEKLRGLVKLIEKGITGPIAVKIATNRELKPEQLESIAKSLYNNPFREKIDLIVLDNGKSQLKNKKILSDERFWRKIDKEGLIKRVHLTNKDIIKLKLYLAKYYKSYSEVYPEGVKISKLMTDFNKMFVKIPFEFFPDYLAMFFGKLNTSYGGSRNALNLFTSLGNYSRHVSIDDDVYVSSRTEKGISSIADPDNYSRGDDKQKKSIGLANIIGDGLSCEFPINDLKEIYKNYMKRRENYDVKKIIQEMNEIMKGKPRNVQVSSGIGWGDMYPIENKSGVLFSTYTNFNWFFPSLNFRGEDFLPQWAYKELKTLGGVHKRNWSENTKQLVKKQIANEFVEFMPMKVLGTAQNEVNVENIKERIISNLTKHKKEVKKVLKDMEKNAPELNEIIVKLKKYDNELKEVKIPKIGYSKKEYNEAIKDMDRFAKGWKDWLKITNVIHKKEKKGLGTFYGKVYVTKP